MQSKLFRFTNFCYLFVIFVGLAACSQSVRLPPGSVEETELSLDRQPTYEAGLMLPGKPGRNRDRSAVDVLLAGANTALAEGEYQRAAAQIERAIRVAPDDPRAYFSLAQVYYYQNRVELGRSFLDKAESLAAGDKVLLKVISHFRQQHAHP